MTGAEAKIIEMIPWWAYLIGGGMGLSFMGLSFMIIKSNRAPKKSCVHSTEFQELASIATGGTGFSHDNKETLAVLRDNLVRQTQILDSVNKTISYQSALMGEMKENVAVLRATQVTNTASQAVHDKRMGGPSR